MAKVPKFLIAANEMADLDGVYILHTRKPRFLAKVQEDGFELVDIIDSFTEYYNGDESKINGLLNRLADWYKAYKIHKYGSR
ncbi:MAG: hypothetical protein LBS43_09155 [Prevotellaceae bacterium]|jgi:hypothetical protein|nr:hypothetical protein [Prevotellaceae bacterium]